MKYRFYNIINKIDVDSQIYQENIDINFER